MMQTARRISVLTPAILLVAVSYALAAGTGVQAIDNAKAPLTTFVQGIAGIGAIFLLGILVWDFVQHRNIARSMFELLGVVLLGLLAVNANAVTTFFNVGGALI
jgi:peptidoglycan/LPS O-acetylase OafA/YrhL